MTHLPSWMAPAGLYLLVGALVAALLLGRGQGGSVALCALPCWPWMLGLLQAPRSPGRGGEDLPPAPGGPLQGAILEAFQALATCGRDAGLDVDLDVGDLREALLRVDLRLAGVDRILAATPSDAAGPLRQAWDRVHEETLAVLSGIHALRVQVGLLALSQVRGPAVHEVQARLRDLRTRVASLAEHDRTSPDALPIPKRGDNPLP